MSVLDYDPQDPATKAWVDELLVKLEGPTLSWDIVTRKEVRQLARLAKKLLSAVVE